MRSISGNFKGSKLYIPKNKNTRPLKDLARESIFNLLTHSNKISFQLKQINVLDLYAGTGSFGLECLSREAKKVCFIENEKSAFIILKKNIEKLKLQKKTEVFLSDVYNLIKKKKLNSKFDLIFCDPPFKDSNIKNLIELIYNSSLLNSDGILILHRNKSTEENLPDYLKVVEERIYGISKIMFGRLSS